MFNLGLPETFLILLSVAFFVAFFAWVIRALTRP